MTQKQKRSQPITFTTTQRESQRRTERETVTEDIEHIFTWIETAGYNGSVVQTLPTNQLRHMLSNNVQNDSI